MPVRVRLPELEHWKAQVKCQTACPVATDAGRYVQLIADERDEDAYLVARAPNPFASVCGRVCAAPCEDACRRGAIDAPISIRALKRHVCESFGVEWSNIQAAVGLDRRIGADHLTVTPERGFSGGCLPKDLDGLIAAARSRGDRHAILLRAIASFNRLVRRDHAAVRE